MLKKYSLPLILLLSLGLSACSSNAKEDDGNPKVKELTFLSNFPSETLDPHLNYTAVRAGVNETLVKINEEMEIEPWLAESWTTTDKGHTWNFKIRNNVTFQNGEKLDAEAVKKSLERNIEVSEAMKTALNIKEMKADGQQLKIVTNEPLPHFPSELVHPNTAILDADEKDIEEKPVGTGPFKTASFSPGNKLELERYDAYWAGKAKLSKATFTFNEDANARTLALQSGDADIVYRPSIESMESLKNDSSIKTDIAPSFRTHLLMYNTKDENLKNLHVRKAFDYLIDREEVASSVMAGQAERAEGPFLSAFPFTPSYDKKEFSIEKAMKHFEHAGFQLKNGKVLKNGKPLSFKLLTYSYRPELPLMAQMLQSEAKQLGITIEIQQVENIDEYMAKKEDWDLATYSLITSPRGDASFFLNTAYMEGGAINPGSINNQELTSKITELNRTLNEEQRNKLAKEAVSLIDKNRFHSFIVHPNNFAAYSDDVLNWKLSKSEYYILTKDVDVKK
ncbi:ABC transporter substrate-binding protein [Fictibacillus nanhaiensis]|uniref:nickel ABC transporter substrate-binding protein n=1 Tax=Fictibacillus nanhaiensis TaxID=742169 RepID=UPI001C97473E|nr:nickel ABC transporter substrate-binding protein [Fictibacillus nanhaiensis]MBY6038406.1 ABC transporter substrate-binding protein [Fictibacillus nanhaiensis]